MPKLFNDIKNNPLEYLFYLFVFLLPWQTRWIVVDAQYQGEVFEYGRISLYLFDLILIGLLVLYFFLRLFKRESGITNYELRIKYIFIGCLLFVVYCLLSVVWADEKIISLYWGMRMLLGLGLFYAIQKINFSKLKLAVVVVIAGATQGLLGIWQFMEQGVWSSKWLGMAGQSARELGSSVVEFGLERWLRAYGGLPHPNVYGALLVLSFAATVYLMTKIQNKYHKLFLIFSTSFIWLGILFSYSRASWIGMGLVFMGAVWVVKGIKENWIKKFGKWLLIYGLLLLALFTVATWPIVKTRLNIGEPARLEIKSNFERVNGYKEAGEMVKGNLILGAGIGNYTFALRDKDANLKIWDIQPVHNVPLLALGELGVIGFLIIVLLNYCIIKLLIKRKKWSYFYLLLVIYGLLFFDHFWWTLGSGLYILWLIMGLVVLENKKSLT